MTITEAIRLKELEGDEFLKADPDALDKADRLSIEALKREQHYRTLNQPCFTRPLPGETED